jgi:hypothetical protein
MYIPRIWDSARWTLHTTIYNIYTTVLGQKFWLLSSKTKLMPRILQTSTPTHNATISSIWYRNLRKRAQRAQFESRAKTNNYRQGWGLGLVLVLQSWWLSLDGPPIASALPFKLEKLVQQHLKHLAVGGLQYYHFTRKKSYTGKHALLQRLSTQSLPKLESLSLLQSHPAAAHFTGVSRDKA